MGKKMFFEGSTNRIWRIRSRKESRLLNSAVSQDLLDLPQKDLVDAAEVNGRNSETTSLEELGVFD